MFFIQTFLKLKSIGPNESLSVLQIFVKRKSLNRPKARQMKRSKARGKKLEDGSKDPFFSPSS